MSVNQLSKEDVEFFFNKYKYNSELIVNLERKLLKESYNYDKWHLLLKENSSLTRRLFAENQTSLEKYVYSVLADANELPPETASFYLLHVLFFLFENHNDSLITDNLVIAIQNCSSTQNKRGIFDSNIDLGISRIISNKTDSIETEQLFTKAKNQFPDIPAVNDTILKVHLMFCFLFQLLNESLALSPNLAELIQTANEASNTLEQKMDKDVYEQMWNGATDFPLHIKLLQRFFKIYAIFGWERIISKKLSSFATTQEYETDPTFIKDSSFETISQWIKDEYEAEYNEGRINSLIFTAYIQLQLITKQVSYGMFIDTLAKHYASIREKETTCFFYPENSFPNDDDPVSSQFADLLDTVKIFSESFCFVFILMQELFVHTKDSSLRKQIRNDTEQYYIQMPYADKGIILDPFIVENTKLLLQNCSSTESCFSFLHKVFLHRQISTSIHFSMVSKMAVLCFKHFYETRPDLFSPMHGFETEESGASFVYESALCHDIGKLYCTNLVNLHFRKITDSEFSTLSQHAEQGANLIEQIPLLKKYADVVRGHHKWYDGTQGYPVSFNNTKSPYKVLIDLISICDSIDAATDTLGRNYTKGKSFDKLLEELRTGAGTRYSPDLVSLLINDPSLKSQIAKMTGEGRSNVYYEIYNQYVSPHIVFSSEDEKTIHKFSEKDTASAIAFYKKCYPSCDEDTIKLHLASLTNGSFVKGYILCDKRNTIYAALFGMIRIPLTTADKRHTSNYLDTPSKLPKDSQLNNTVFTVEDFLVLPEFRRKGLGTTLVSFVESDLKTIGNIKISIDIVKDFHSESFFWINGFHDSKFSRMEKDIGNDSETLAVLV